MSFSRKRKYPSGPSTSHSKTGVASLIQSDIDNLYSIQAYEADVIRGPQAHSAAQSLEITHLQTEAQCSPQEVIWKIGDGLIRWGGEKPAKSKGEKAHAAFLEDEDEEQWGSDEKHSVWVDRYDARLLLDSLPSNSLPETTSPDSPTGWSDLPSDTEDTFFFSPDEVEDFRREKRRRLMDENREERLRALRAEDQEDDEEAWGGSDEEPDDLQKELMRRTATHISLSPNPPQLEMRILANYGGDQRFAFLRGRWSRAWKRAKMKVRNDGEEPKESGQGLGDLTGYGDSEEESDANQEERKENSVDKLETALVTPVSEAVKEARRARAREWVTKRRTLALTAGKTTVN